MKNLKYYVIAFILFAALVLVLLNNRAQLEAKARNDKISAYPVTVSTVELKEVADNIVLVGTIVGDNNVQIVSEAQGKVTGVFAKVGDYKSAGSVIAQLDDELKKSAYETAQVNFEKSKKDFERYDILYKNKSVSDVQYEQAKLAFYNAQSLYVAAKKDYENTKITAPISGVITSRSIDMGTYVNKNMPVADIVDISKLKVKIGVAEKDVFSLKKGDKVTVTTDVYPGVQFSGTIATISDQGDQAHNYAVEVSLTNSREHPLKSGMFGQVTFLPKATEPRLIVPRDALLGSIKNPQVFVIENGVVHLRNVTVGGVYNNNLEVIKGLNKGDKVVVNGQNNLEENTAVYVINKD
ncbi:MAG TPA: efflux RND transporter periplasmic adaptor subunit [Ignavibacteriaceae bacterium]